MDKTLLSDALIAERDMVVRIPHLGLVRARTRKISRRGMSFSCRCELFAPQVRVWISLTPDPDRPFEVLDIPGYVHRIKTHEVVVVFDDHLNEQTSSRLCSFIDTASPDLAWDQVG